MNSGRLTVLLHDALRSPREVVPSTAVPFEGEKVPFFVLTSHSTPVERMRRTDFATVVLVPQNGHVAEVRTDIGVKSISPALPVHAHSSF